MAITAPTYRAINQTLVTSNASVSPPLPTGWAQDDIVIVAIAQTNNASEPAFTDPSGWTYLGNQPMVGVPSAATNLRIDCWWRRMQSGDVAAAFANGVANAKFATTIAFIGCHGAGSGQATSPIDFNSAGSDTAVGTNWSIAAGSTSFDNSMMVYQLATEAASTTAPITTAANTTLASVNVPYNTAFSTNNGNGRAQVYGVCATAGSTGTLTGTRASGYGVSYHIALRGVDGGGGGTVLGGRTSLLGVGL